MKRIAKIALGALLMAGTAFAVATPAAARVSIGIGFGGPGYYGPPPRYAVCDPYSRYYDPYYCGDDDYYYGPPLFIDGFWFNSGGRYRDFRGHRQYWVHGGWHGYSGGHGGGGYGGGHGGGGYGGGHGGGGYGGGHGGGGYGGGHGGGGYGGGHGGGGYGGGHGGGGHGH